MLLLLIVFLLGTLSFSFFITSIRLSSVNKIFINTPKEIFQSSIPLLEEYDEKTPYFDKTELENKLNEYYINTLSKYVESFKLDFYYFNQKDKSMCINKYCDAVDVHIDALIIFSCTYNKHLTYQIVEGNFYGHN